MNSFWSFSEKFFSEVFSCILSLNSITFFLTYNHTCPKALHCFTFINIFYQNEPFRPKLFRNKYLGRKGFFNFMKFYSSLLLTPFPHTFLRNEAPNPISTGLISGFLSNLPFFIRSNYPKPFFLYYFLDVSHLPFFYPKLIKLL
ncbi:hypothetical protein CW304_10065 [Bacillus sp. UFRGS-B20]|nr:hypothetical protein CW304_10065 [Bacillus sp. UFRGS-B20]